MVVLACGGGSMKLVGAPAEEIFQQPSHSACCQSATEDQKFMIEEAGQDKGRRVAMGDTDTPPLTICPNIIHIFEEMRQLICFTSPVFLG
jgi:hypothetical protein